MDVKFPVLIKSASAKLKFNAAAVPSCAVISPSDNVMGVAADWSGVSTGVNIGSAGVGTGVATIGGSRFICNEPCNANGVSSLVVAEAESDKLKSFPVVDEVSVSPAKSATGMLQTPLP